MATLNIRNIPDDLYERLLRYARASNRSVSEVVVRALERELERMEWQERLARRPKTDLGIDAATLIAEERRRRDAELGGAEGG
ncbi:MAG: toxin-antitoxin system HicB family antitoxin [Chloroflexota bacterium]|nr:toxin-antitoxin system HicB family antitoxin [Chloroflexota bacterium]MDE2918328.1 toxin-antitoxin system HicB family antitoxin [Chloroflexota bacterium]